MLYKRFALTCVLEQSNMNPPGRVYIASGNMNKQHQEQHEERTKQKMNRLYKEVAHKRNDPHTKDELSYPRF